VPVSCTTRRNLIKREARHRTLRGTSLTAFLNRCSFASVVIVLITEGTVPDNRFWLKYNSLPQQQARLECTDIVTRSAHAHALQL
jgi:hypothetical protein